MTGSEIREKYLSFFEERGHKVLPSSSLIPHNDPSILWTAAGMVPFKPFFTGAAKPEYVRVATCQKCIRTPDIESVGKTARHHTFFEMLGNFSFGDYFKENAIPWAWEFVTEHLHIPADKLWITIYLDDDEAFEIWNKTVGVPAERIVRLDKDTNFWEIGVGPCGPCSEIYVDLGEERGCASPGCRVACDCDRYLEIWNLVFIQFFKDEAGEYTLLESKGIDTGFGLERAASVLQGVPSNFDTDLFREIMDYSAGLFDLEYGLDERTDVSLKVIADHCRAITFAITDGAMPSNEGRGYVIRRLLRRAVRFGRLLGIQDVFMPRVAGAVVRQMGPVYPELVERQEHVLRVIRTEEERFAATLAQGTEMLNRVMREAKVKGNNILSGSDAFKLYDTYGFPLELTQEMAAEQGLTVDLHTFNLSMEEQRQRARSARQETDYISERDAVYKEIREQTGETVFIGYDSLEGNSRILAILKNGERTAFASEGEEVEIVLDITPCYAESGGQIGDHGNIFSPDGRMKISQVVKPVENLFVHRGIVTEGLINEHDQVRVEVLESRRMSICRNHTATHLVHKALKEVLGSHVNQAGSLVETDRLRFDFTHFTPLSAEEINNVEAIVNNAILVNMPVEGYQTSLQEAKEAGAAALFDESYGEQVRVVKIGDFSLELCGGTHLRRTSEAGFFKLLGESSIGAGIRRIEAVTGESALSYISTKEDLVANIATLLKVSPGEIIVRLESVINNIKELEAENEALQARLAKYQVQDLLGRSRSVKGVNVLTGSVASHDMDSLRGMVDLLRDKMESGVIVLGSSSGEKVNLVAAVTRDLLDRGLHAGKLVKEVACIVGGGGGGRPDMAQAGGKDPSRLNEALDKAYGFIEKQIK